MSLLDQEHKVENDFVKGNPNFLKSMFGATDLNPLWIADMDFKVAPAITKEIQRIAERGIYAYEFIESDVFEAIKNWNLKRHQLELKSEAFVKVPGVLTGISILIRELSKEGDGVLIQTPVYHQFFKVITAANRTVVDNALKVVDGKYAIDFEDLELKFKEQNVKLMLLCNPHNPVGKVWNKEEMQQINDLANKYNVTILSDEIHSDIILPEAKFNSIASVDTLKKHIAIIGSPAKTFGMHSISNGFIYIADETTHKQLKEFIGGMYLDHGNVFSSYATIAAYTKGEEWLNELIAYLETSNKWIENFMSKELPNVKLYKPEGTYQIWLDFSALNLSDAALKNIIVDKAKLALTPGDWFGKNHSQYMRMNIASPLATIQDAFKQLKKAIDAGADISEEGPCSQGACCGC